MGSRTLRHSAVLEKDATLPMEANINLDMIGASQLFSNSAINLNHNPWPLLHPSDAYMWFYLQQLANRPSNMLKVTEQGYGLDLTMHPSL